MADLFLSELRREELIEIVENAIRESVDSLIASAGDPRIVDRSNLASILDLSIAQIDRLTASDTIPSLKIGSSRRYVLDDVLAALREQEEGGSDE